MYVVYILKSIFNIFSIEQTKFEILLKVSKDKHLKLLIRNRCNIYFWKILKRFATCIRTNICIIIPNQKIEVLMKFLMQFREHSKQKIWDNLRGSIYFPIPWHLVNLYFFKCCFLVNLFQSKNLNKLN